MKDQEFLIWLHERLIEVHEENPNVDYMHKFRAIIRSTPPEKLTHYSIGGNNLEDLKRNKTL